LDYEKTGGRNDEKNRFGGILDSLDFAAFVIPLLLLLHNLFESEILGHAYRRDTVLGFVAHEIKKRKRRDKI